jgi:hypothetical protein
MGNLNDAVIYAADLAKFHDPKHALRSYLEEQTSPFGAWFRRVPRSAVGAYLLHNSSVAQQLYMWMGTRDLPSELGLLQKILERPRSQGMVSLAYCFCTPN